MGKFKNSIPPKNPVEKKAFYKKWWFGFIVVFIIIGVAGSGGRRRFQGQRRAINSQKNNMGITNVVSADQVGKFPDSNIGDALKRISGINVQYDQGEARFGKCGARVRPQLRHHQRQPRSLCRRRYAQRTARPHSGRHDSDHRSEQGSNRRYGRRRHRRQHQPRHQELPLQAYHCRHRRNRLQLGERKGATEPWLHLRRPLLQRQTRLDCIGLLSELTFWFLRHRIVWEQDDNGKTYVNDYQSANTTSPANAKATPPHWTGTSMPTTN